MHIDSVLSFIPIDRRHSLARGVPLPSAVTGSVLFADISGFTPLTESLARSLGARYGAEELTRQLNLVYDALIEQVDRLGGSILSFSGDAITCWFDGEVSPPDAALRALTCSFALQTAMGAFERVTLPNGDTVRLSLKAAVASGDARRLLVGDPDVLVMDVLAGATLTRMAQAQSNTTSGEVVSDERTIELLPGICDIAEWRQDDESDAQFAVIRQLHQIAPSSPWEDLEADAITPEQIRSWMLPALYERQDVSSTELRPAVALFVSFDGIDYDNDPDCEQKLDRYVRWSQSVLLNYDGTMLQVSVGDKGSYFYAAFGAPTAHENNAVRGASAALELRKLPAELNYIRSVRIGITQGIMRTGAYGGTGRRVYGVIGDDVNLAARLMTHADPGMILISESVQKSLEGTFFTGELAPITVKGKQESLSVFRLVAKTEETERKPVRLRRLVGRSAELGRLMKQVSPLADGQSGGSTWIYGDAGIGKTHLIHALREQLGDLVAWFRFPTDQLVHESLHAVLPILHEYFNFYLAINEVLKKTLFDRRIDRLIRGLRGHADEMVEELSEARWYLGALMGLHWHGSSYENADPKIRFQRSLNAITTLLQAESLIKPLVIHVQDAQWLDSDSRSVIESLIESTPRFPMALIIDSREVNHAMFERGAITLFPVRELDRAGVAELATVILNGKLRRDAVNYLVQKANGNPFFTEQLALDLCERGAFVRDASGEWIMNKQTIDDMPVNINAVLIARLDRLVSPLRVTVQVASILGQEFEVPVLERMMDDQSSVRQKVTQAADETIWVSQSESVYVFRHALLRDAAYSMQLQERLRELHARAGAAIEHVYADNLIVKSPDLAYHYEKSGTNKQAVYYLIKSAQYMLSLHANHEAVGYYERAAALAEKTDMPPADIAPIYEGLGDLHEVAGEYLQAFEDYDFALKDVPADRFGWRTTLHRKKGQVLQKWGRYDEATQSFEAGLVELQGDLKPEEACQLYAGLSMINYRQGKLDDALELANVGLMMAHMQDDKRNLAYAMQTLGVIHWKMGDFADSMQYYTESLSLWKQSKNTLGLAGIQNNLGLLYQSMGDLAQALIYLENARQLFDQVGNLHGLACAYDNLGEVYMQQGEESLAMDCLEKAVSILSKIGLDETQVFSGMWQAGTW